MDQNTRMNKILAAVGLCLFMAGCQTENPPSLKEGAWRAVLAIQGQELPFNVEIIKDSAGGLDAYVINAGERLLLDEVEIKGDSVIMPLHIFDASLRAKLMADSLKGSFVRHYAPGNDIPFTAVYGKTHRFTSERSTPSHNFSGKYSVSIYNEKDTSHVIGLFRQYGDSVTGTFLSKSGDYRFLQGNVINGKMHLSGFDGNHVYLFTADSTAPGEITGLHYSGLTKKVRWKGVKDDKAELPDANSITFLKEGYDGIDFRFPNVNGDTISPSDEKFRGKVLVLQIFGTWCPNCMDETNFLAPWYKENRDRGVEIIGLAFERNADFGYASKRVSRMLDKLGVTYDFVIAGTNEKESTSKALPMLNGVAAFPTTIFVGKDRKVKKIHTGFSGPGTGEYYNQFIEEFNQTINTLLSEEKGALSKLAPAKR